MGHFHNGILSGGKKEENFAFCNSMYRPGEHYTNEISQSEKDNTICFHSYAEANEQTELKSKTETDS